MRPEQSLLARYLDRHSEVETTHLTDFPVGTPYQHCLIIPAYDETPDFMQRLQQLSQPGLLIILVINQPADSAALATNQTLWAWSLHSGRLLWQQAAMGLIGWPDHKALLVVDRFQSGRGIPRKQGVGLARKIGCDIAVALLARGTLQTHWLHSSDADTQLPTDYFATAANTQADYSALIYPFRHRDTGNALSRATQVYETALHYYVKGLRWAGSPYAYHTIGSCLAVSPAHYCMAHGFPKKSGGEDFYLLNKLAKLAPIKQLDSQPIHIEPRASQRVPFGTGPAVRKILALENVSHYRTYHPHIFAELRQLLQQLQQFPGAVAEDKTDHWLQQLSPASRAALVSLDYQPLIDHLRRLPDPAAGIQHCHWWFDGFRTLKYIHWLQTHDYPPMGLAEAEAQLQCQSEPSDASAVTD